MSFAVKDKVVLITGAASGIGAAAARLAAASGAHVIAADGDGPRVQGVAADCLCIGLTHDVTNPQDWDNAIATAVHHHGRLDALVCSISQDVREPRASGMGATRAIAQMRKQAGNRPATGSIIFAAPEKRGAEPALDDLLCALNHELAGDSASIRLGAVSAGPSHADAGQQEGPPSENAMAERILSLIAAQPSPLSSFCPEI